MGCCGGSQPRRDPLEPFCAMLERLGAAIPVRVESTAGGVRFHVAHGGFQLDLIDIVRTQSCRGVTGRAILEMAQQLAVWQKLSAPLAGETVTLSYLQDLRR